MIITLNTKFIILQNFDQWATGLSTIVLPHSEIDRDLTDIYFI